ncbi:MAG: hypothetical protein PVF50_04295 [Gammaproteobacteria bacterium]
MPISDGQEGTPRVRAASEPDLSPETDELAVRSCVELALSPFDLTPGQYIVSHHENNPEKIEKYAKINAYHLSLFGDLIERLG